MSSRPQVAPPRCIAAAHLLARAQCGDSEAFGDLCQLHETRLVRQAAALCGDTMLAEDLAQDVLLEAWRNLDRYRGQAQFFTWLCGIMINRHRNWRRHRTVPALSSLFHSDREAMERTMDNLADPGATPGLSLEHAERAQLLRECLDRLPAKQRAVVYLRFYVDDSIESIAAALGCSVGTVKSRLFHGLDRLTHMTEVQALRLGKDCL